MVERTAHNGLVVGSSPTKPKIKLIYMKFASKYYKTTKTKNYLKTNNLFFFFSGINQNSSDWIKTEQGLKNMQFNYYKVFNKTSIKTFNQSIYKNIDPIINSTTFLIKPTSNNIILTKKTLLNLESFVFLALKVNDKIYSSEQIKHLNALNYYNSKLLFYQFGITNIKSYMSK